MMLKMTEVINLWFLQMSKYNCPIALWVTKNAVIEVKSYIFCFLHSFHILEYIDILSCRNVASPIKKIVDI